MYLCFFLSLVKFVFLYFCLPLYGEIKICIHYILNTIKTDYKSSQNLQGCRNRFLKTQVLRFFKNLKKPQKPNVGFRFLFLSCNLLNKSILGLLFLVYSVKVMLNACSFFNAVIREKGKGVPCMGCFFLSHVLSQGRTVVFGLCTKNLYNLKNLRKTKNLQTFFKKNQVFPALGTDLREHFFSKRVINTWNKLDNDIVCSSSLNIFRNHLLLLLFSSLSTIRAGHL